MTWTYFKPEDHGLVGVGEVDWMGGGGCYEWDTTTVMYHPGTDTFYWEHGSGCSCNGPLEDVRGLADLKSGTLWELSGELGRELSHLSHYLSSDEKDRTAHDVASVLEAALKARSNRG